MIVVLDTNVLISSLLSAKGAPTEIIRRWAADDFEVATSPPLLAELQRVLHYPRVQKYLKFSPSEINLFLKRLETVAIVVEPQLRLEVIAADPDDNRVLECAVAANAAYIISGNTHLLDLKTYRQIVVLNPIGFLAALD